MSLSTQTGFSRTDYGVLPEVAADPSAINGAGILYTKDVSGTAELFYEDSAGNVQQISTGGGGGFVTSVNGDSGPAVVIDGNDILVGGTFTPGVGTVAATDTLKEAFQKVVGNVTSAVEDVFTPTNGQTVFTLSQTPSSAAAFALYLNGQLRLRGTDYTQSGTTLTWLDPSGLTLVTTDEVIARYNDTASGNGTAGQNSFIFQPSGTASSNVYTSWATLVSAIPATSEPKNVYLDKTFAAITIPAGAWNMQNSFICGLDQKGPIGSTAVTLTDGCIFTNPLGFKNNLIVTANNTSTPVISLTTAATGPTFTMSNNVTLRNAGSQPIFGITRTAPGGILFLFELNCSWVNVGYEVAELLSGSSGSIFLQLFDVNTISSDTLRGGAGNGTFQVRYNNPSSSVSATQTNLSNAFTETKLSSWSLLSWGLTDMSIPYMSGGLGYPTEVASGDFIWNYSSNQFQIGAGTAGGSPSVAGQGQQYVISASMAGYNAEVVGGAVMQWITDGSTSWIGTWSSNDFAIYTNNTARIVCGATGFSGVSSVGAFSPTQTWDNQGSEAQSTVTYNAGGSISGLERNVVANFSSPDTFILPAVAGNIGRILTFINKTTNALTLQGNGAENINGANTYLVGAQYKSATVISDGVEWYVTAKGV